VARDYNVVGKLNRTLRGWANYFQVGMTTAAYRTIDNYTTMRLSRWLRHKHNVKRRWHGGYPSPYLYETLGLVGNLPVRFDERGVESEIW
jgi:RNA-directed DNA polymerase